MVLIMKFIPPIIIPNKIIEFWLAHRVNKANTEFEKTVRRISHYAAHHGARSTCMRLFGSPRIFLLNTRRKKVFFEKCHYGFSVAQNEIIRLLPEIEAKIPQLRKSYREEVRRYKRDRKPPVPRYSKVGKAYSEQLFESMLLREVADSIAWQILGDDGTKVRALIQGVFPGPSQSAQLQSMLATVNKLNSEDKSSFVLITDITSCIQVGDLLVRLPTGQFGFYELKEGMVNDHIESLLTMSPTDHATRERFGELVSKYGKPFTKQLERVLRQKQRMQLASDYINESVGIDIQFNRPKITDVKPRSTVTYHKEVNQLLRIAKKKGEQYLVIDECLILGAFNTVKLKRSNDVCKKDFQHQVWHMFFEDWSECPYGKEFDDKTVTKHFEYMLLPVWEMRDKVQLPTHRPIFITGLEESFVFDILFERISLFFYFSPQRFVALCKNKGIDASWVTGKEYLKIKSEALKNKIILLDIHDGIIRIKYGGQKLIQDIALGTLFKIIYEFERPSAVVKLLREDMDTLPERLAQAEKLNLGAKKNEE